MGSFSPAIFFKKCEFEVFLGLSGFLSVRLVGALALRHLELYDGSSKLI